MALILGLGCKARSGKDTVADYIVKHNPSWKKTAFADNLKRACREIFGLTDEQLWGEMKGVVDKFWGVTPRQIMQQVGTECLRERFHQQVWVRSLERAIMADYMYNYVVTDVRFPNEAEAIKRWGGYTVLVDRPSTHELPEEAENHASETSMDGYRWDYILRNDDSLEVLFAGVEQMLRHIRNKA